MKDMIESSAYRAALDRLDIAKKALRQISKFESSEGYMARLALETIAAADAWDSTPLDPNGIPIPPASTAIKGVVE